VIVACVGVAIAASEVAHLGVGARTVGALISTSVSAAFLLLIALMNVVIFRSVWRTFRHVRAGGAYLEEDFDLLLNSRGFVARIFRPLFRLVSKSWHMYLLGFLFGLGFDTATEVALLGISGTQAAHGTSIWLILVFPALFAAGMSLVDTTDGVLMLGAYQWAFVKPVRKLFYNLVITAVSIAVALGIGGIEALGLLETQLHLSGSFWQGVAALNGNFNGLGFLIIGIFIAAWVVSVLIYRYKDFDSLEVTAPPAAAGAERRSCRHRGG
jgi:high-affinity nickel-transport protein